MLAWIHTAKWKHSMMFGIGHAICALFLSIWWIWSDTIGDKIWSLLWAGPAGAFITGTLIWRWVVVRKRKYGLWRGMLAGMLTSNLFYAVAGYLIVLQGNFFYWVLWMREGAYEQQPIDPFSALWLVTSGSVLWGLLLFSWFSVPAGVLLGGAVGHFQKKAYQQ